jgi:hypothetical protein
MNQFDLNISTKKYTIEIDTYAKKGYFEHKIYGEDKAGSLLFDAQNMLSDYDGVSSLPFEVKNALIKNNLIYLDQIENC